MSDHTLSFNAKQEAAAQLIVDALNAGLAGATPGTATVDSWLRDLCLAPIKNKIAELKAQNVAAVDDAYDSATKAVQNQVRTILGLPTI